MRLTSLLLAAVAVAACSSGVYRGSTVALAQTSGPQNSQSTASLTVTLSAEQTAAVRARFGSNNSSRGRGRNGGLPPGIARNLERGKALPPGIAKQHLPQDLLVSLPRLDNTLEYVVAAGKLLLVEAATQVVRDILIDAI